MPLSRGLNSLVDRGTSPITTTLARRLYSGVRLIAKRAANERIVVELVKSGRKLKASREGSKCRNCGT